MPDEDASNERHDRENRLVFGQSTRRTFLSRLGMAVMAQFFKLSHYRNGRLVDIGRTCYYSIRAKFHERAATVILLERRSSCNAYC